MRNRGLSLYGQMRNRGRIVAMDVDEARLNRSAVRLSKAGVDNVQRHTISQGRDAWLKRRKRSFDRVLVDAPCSGIGAWRRNPDARWLRRTRPLAELLPVQAFEDSSSPERMMWCPSVILYHDEPQCITLRYAKPCHAALHHAAPCFAAPCFAAPSFAIPCFARAVPCPAVPCFSVPCPAVLFRALPCRALPCCAVL